MRTLLGVTFIAVCLPLAGCKTAPSGRGADTNSTAGSTPFMGSPTSESPTSPAPSKNPAGLASTGSGKAGILAGRVLDENSRLKPGALIQVIDLDGPRDGAAPLKVLANKEGFFDVAGLEGGHTYRLVASVKDGVRLLVGSARAVAPNIRVAIFLNEEQSIPAGGAPSRSAGSGDSGTTAMPAVSIGKPTPSVEGVTTPMPPTETRQPAAVDGSRAPFQNPQAGAGPGEVKPPPTPVEEDRSRTADTGTTPRLAPPVDRSTDPSLIADRDFTRIPAANISGPGREPPSHKPQTPPYSPPAPPETFGMGAGTEGMLPVSTAPSAAPLPAVPSAAPPSAAVSAAPAAVPSVVSSVPSAGNQVPFCTKVGDRVENFGLTDFDGKVWELRKQRTGKLVLLDFWYSDCGPCRRAIPHLIDLQKKYGYFGLQVVGIAYESGPLSDKQKAIRPVRARYGINYTTLFGGGGTGLCPMRKELAINAFPTLVLLDETGKIIFRTTDGLTDQAGYDLEMEIRRQLRLPLR